MDAKIWNANTHRKNARKSKRKMLALPNKVGDTGQKTMQRMQGIAGVIEQETETLAIVIPCRIAEKPDRVQPLKLVTVNKLGGVESAVWQCEQCTKIFHSRRSWEKHKAIKWIVAAWENKNICE